MALASTLHRHGHALLPAALPAVMLAALRVALTAQFASRPGVRGLVEIYAVRAAAVTLRDRLIGEGVFSDRACPIQAIAFNKTAATNWKVPWHQDLQFPFRGRVAAVGFEDWCRKGEVDYAQPPRDILESMLAVRVHLDPCGSENGPLRVAPRSHRAGVLSRAAMDELASKTLPMVCEADEGDAVLMRPLLLHASSPARTPTHRRVLHFVFADCALPPGLAWAVS